MMRLGHASVIAVLFLLAWATTAHAECAWANASYDQSPIVGVVNPMCRLAATQSTNSSSFVKERKYGFSTSCGKRREVTSPHRCANACVRR
jgi:hypothetical protein